MASYPVNAIARIKLQSAEQELEIMRKKVEVGVAPPSDYKIAGFVRDMAAAELKHDPVEVARLQLQKAELELAITEAKFKVGKANDSERIQAKAARDMAAMVYSQKAPKTNSP